MPPETLINGNKTIIPDEILKKIKGKELIKWNMKKNGNIELEVEEIPSECIEFAEELEEIREEMKAGKKYKLDVDSLDKKFGL